MKIAHVTLIRDEEPSAIVTKHYREEVRGFDSIQWAPSHVVFKMVDGTIIAYHADRIHELVTYIEEEE